MTMLPAEPGDVIDVRPLGTALPDTPTGVLMKQPWGEIRRMVLPAGKELRQHSAPAPIIVQCLEGSMDFTAFGRTSQLEAGAMLYLPAAEPHSVRAREDTSFLLMLIRTG